MLQKPRNVVIGCLALALVVGYFVTGHYLYKAQIGLDVGAFPAGEALRKLALAVAGIVFFLVRAAVRGQVAAVDPNAHEAFDRLKQEGKVRFLGFSSHSPNLVQVANTAVESGRFDVMMLAYH